MKNSISSAVIPSYKHNSRQFTCSGWPPLWRDSLLGIATLLSFASLAHAQNQNCPFQPYEYDSSATAAIPWVGSKQLAADIGHEYCTEVWSGGNPCGGVAGPTNKTVIPTGACALTGPDWAGQSSCPYTVYNNSSGQSEGTFNKPYAQYRRNTQVCPPAPPTPPPDFPAQDVCPLSNPVCPATGIKYQDEKDYEAADGLEFRRHYASSRPFPSPLIAFAPAFGNVHWLHSYERSLHELDLAAAGGMKWVAKRPDGTLLYFGIDRIEVLNRTSTGKASKIDPIIVGGGWNLRLANGDIERYDASGRLLSITARAGLVACTN